jgi:glycosyltransferase involved in cell wall biosynthesis
VLAGWAHALVRSGVTAIDVVSIVGDPSKALNQFPPEVRHVVLPGGRAAHALMPLRRYLRNERPDVLMSAVININLLAIVAAKTTKWPGKLIITHHHPIALSHADTWKDNKHAARLLYRFADASVAVSPDVMEDAIRVGRLDRSTITCIPNVLPPPFRLAAAKPPHRWLGPNRPGPVFVTVSRVVQAKNLPLLLEAFARVTADLDARLIIIGKGVAEPETAALIREMRLDDRVDMAGFVDSPRSYLERADAFVLASNEEGFGQVLAEAMSVGLPVISTDATGGGPRFVLDGGRYGVLVPKGDAEALAAAMISMTDASARAKYAALGRERARDFSPSAVGASLVEFIEKICGT